MMSYSLNVDLLSANYVERGKTYHVGDEFFFRDTIEEDIIFKVGVRKVFVNGVLVELDYLNGGDIIIDDILDCVIDNFTETKIIHWLTSSSYDKCSGDPTRDIQYYDISDTNIFDFPPSIKNYGRTSDLTISDFLECTIEQFLSSKISDWLNIDESVSGLDFVEVFLDNKKLEKDIDYSIIPSYKGLTGEVVDRLILDTTPPYNSTIRIKKSLSKRFRPIEGKLFISQEMTDSFIVENLDQSIVSTIDLISPNFNSSSVGIDRAFPDRLKYEYPKFYQFVKGYMEFGDEISSPKEILRNSERYLNIDTVPEDYLENFSNQLMYRMGGEYHVDKRLLLSNINDFYEERSTEKSFDFLMRVKFGSTAKLMKPKYRLFQTSGGDWEVIEKLKVTNSVIGNILFPDKVKRSFLTTLDELSESTETLLRGLTSGTTAIIESSIKSDDFVEYTISGRDGEFKEFEEFEFIRGKEKFLDLHGVILPVIVGVSDRKLIDHRRTYDVIGDGLYSEIRIYRNGLDNQYDIKNSGIGYTSAFIVDGGGNELKVEISTISSEGRRIRSHGSTSSNYPIYDGIYNQRFSYDITSNISMDRYDSAFHDILHPKGFSMYGTRSERIEDVMDMSYKIKGETL